ncbi:hypothetical protein GJAV_G00103930 [Gymnothorax javanicus]|nr:hypothetical protein GJAV_G00103930 [Gymnothorax javanicus]
MCRVNWYNFTAQTHQSPPIHRWSNLGIKFELHIFPDCGGDGWQGRNNKTKPKKNKTKKMLSYCFSPLPKKAQFLLSQFCTKKKKHLITSPFFHFERTKTPEGEFWTVVNPGRTGQQ